jgi:hypothetical protein
VRWERHSTARPLIRADTRPYFIAAATIQTSIPSAEPRFGMLRGLFRLLVPPSAHTIYDHRARARVINYWHQGRRRARSVPPSHPRRKNEENRSVAARMPYGSPLVFAQKQTGLLRGSPRRKLTKKRRTKPAKEAT